MSVEFGNPSIVTGCQEPIWGVAPTCIPPPLGIYYSTQQSGSCPSGFVAQSFVVPAGKFTSLLSQTDADSQAIAYLETLISTRCVRGNPPSVTSATQAVGASLPFNYQIVATNLPASYGATGLPAGLSLNTSTGLITGTITSAALTTYSVPISATNIYGTGTGTLTIIVKAYLTVTIGTFSPSFETSPVLVLQASVDGGVYSSVIAGQNLTAITQLKLKLAGAYSPDLSGRNPGVTGTILTAHGNVVVQSSSSNSVSCSFTPDGTHSGGASATFNSPFTGFNLSPSGITSPQSQSITGLTPTLTNASTCSFNTFFNNFSTTAYTVNNEMIINF